MFLLFKTLDNIQKFGKQQEQNLILVMDLSRKERGINCITGHLDGFIYNQYLIVNG